MGLRVTPPPAEQFSSRLVQQQIQTPSLLFLTSETILFPLMQLRLQRDGVFACLLRIHKKKSVRLHGPHECRISAPLLSPPPRRTQVNTGYLRIAELVRADFSHEIEHTGQRWGAASSVPCFCGRAGGG